MKPHALAHRSRPDDAMAFSPVVVGRIIAVNPKRKTVTAALSAQNAIIRDAPVIALSAGTREGLHTLPKVDTTKAAENTPNGIWDSFTATNTRDTYGIFMYVNNGIERVPRSRPVCIGFIYPQHGQLSFTEEDLYLYRHNSNVYWLVDSNGNYAMEFPDGTHVRIGTSTTLKDIAAIVFDAVSDPWLVPEPTGGGARKIELGLGSGETVVIKAGEIDFTATTIKVNGNLEVSGTTHSSGQVTQGGTGVSLGTGLGINHTHP